MAGWLAGELAGWLAAEASVKRPEGRQLRRESGHKKLSVQVRICIYIYMYIYLFIYIYVYMYLLCGWWAGWSAGRFSSYLRVEEGMPYSLAVLRLNGQAAAFAETTLCPGYGCG